MPVSSVPIGCCADYTGAGKCTVDGEDNNEDKTKEEADMTLSTKFEALLAKERIELEVLSLIITFSQQ